jgi:hypothetical protein
VPLPFEEAWARPIAAVANTNSANLATNSASLAALFILLSPIMIAPMI